MGPKSKASIMKIDLSRPNNKQFPYDPVSSDNTNSQSKAVMKTVSTNKVYPKQPPVLYHQEVIGNDVEVSISTSTELNLVPTGTKKDLYKNENPTKNNSGWRAGNR